MITKLGGRKVLMSVLMIASGIGLDSTVGLSENMMTLMMTIIGAFVAGNIGEHATSALGKKKTGTTRVATPKVDFAPVESKIDVLSQNMELNGKLSGQLNQKMDAIIALASQPQTSTTQPRGY